MKELKYCLKQTEQYKYIRLLHVPYAVYDWIKKLTINPGFTRFPFHQFLFDDSEAEFSESSVGQATLRIGHLDESAMSIVEEIKNSFAYAQIQQVDWEGWNVWGFIK